MNYESKETPKSSKGDIAFNLLKSQAEIRYVDNTIVDFIFPTVERAILMQNQIEHEIGHRFKGYTIRWRGKEWNNKPACLAAQAAVLSKMHKWSSPEFAVKYAEAEKTCECYKHKPHLHDLRKHA